MLNPHGLSGEPKYLPYLSASPQSSDYEHNKGWQMIRRTRYLPAYLSALVSVSAIGEGEYQIEVVQQKTKEHFFFHNFAIYKEYFDFECKGKSIFAKQYIRSPFCSIFKNKSGISLVINLTYISFCGKYIHNFMQYFRGSVV